MSAEVSDDLDDCFSGRGARALKGRKEKTQKQPRFALPDGEHLKVALDHCERALAKAKKPLIAYSGGKDSIATALILAKHFGVRDAVCENSWYFDVHIEDSTKIAKQIGLRCAFVDSYPGMDFLVKRPEFIFAQSGKVKAKLYALRHWRTISRHAEEGGYDLIAFGRRLGSNSVKDWLYEARGRLQFFPIREWMESQVWAYIHANGIETPRLYALGRQQEREHGVTPWTSLPGWKEVYEIQPNIVEAAAKYFPEAERFLESNRR